MSAIVVPFPSVRREMVERNALRIAGMRDQELNIRALLAQTRKAHLRKGIAAQLVDRDLTAMEAALRFHIDRAQHLEGGVA